MNLCPTCHQPLPEPGAIRYITPRELDVLSAFWHLGSYQAVSRFLDLREQTVKNHLYQARNRNGVHTSEALAAMFMDELRTKAELLASHKSQRMEVA